MSLTSTRDRYGFAASLLHWIIGALILTLLLTGLCDDLLPKQPTIAFHKALGIVALTLALVRLVWWVIDHRRPDNADLSTLERGTATVVKLGLAAFSVLLPVTGWLMSSAADKPISLFGLATVPPLIEPDKGLAHLFKALHAGAGNGLLLLLAVHIAAALYHHFMREDDVLRRIMPHG